jgi:hypothetical protein
VCVCVCVCVCVLSCARVHGEYIFLRLSSMHRLRGVPLWSLCLWVGTLEHLVDTSLVMEADPGATHRLLRSTKNRFGSSSEVSQCS